MNSLSVKSFTIFIIPVTLLVATFWLLPQVTALALSLGALAGGSVIVEYIFTYPGMGYLLYDGIVNGDYTVIQGVVYFLIVGVALGVLIIDLLYPLIDPRISYQRK